MPETGKSIPVKLPPLVVRALSASLLLAGFMVYATSVWADPYFSFPFLSKARWAALLLFAGGLGLFTASFRRLFRDLPPPRLRDATLTALCAGLVIGLFSSGAAHPWFFMAHWFTRGPGLGLFPASLLFSLLSTAAVFLLLWRRPSGKALGRVLVFLLVVLQVTSLAFLLLHTRLAPLYRDDHPSFMFRIREFVETYPAMSVFNPWWNAGVVNAVGASSGVGSVALSLFPLWKSLPVDLCYTPAIGFLFVVVSPLLTLAGLRAVRAPWAAALTGAILSLGVSRMVFVWGLHFGTVGAVFSMSFLPLFALLLYRAFIMRRADGPTLFGLLLAAFFLAQWPPCLLPAAALILGCLLNARRFRLHIFLRLLLLLVVLLLLLLPNIGGLLASRDLFRFVADTSVADASAPPLPPVRDWFRALSALLAARLPEVHPVITFLGLGGLFFLPHRRLRRLLLPAVYGLLLLAAWGPIAAPRLQLERMVLPALLLAAVPAALLAGKAFTASDPRLLGVKAVLFALLLVGGMTVVSLYGGEGYAPYTSLPPEVRAFADTVRREVPPDGRLLFLGRTVHSFGGGHVAYLPLLTGREMLACDYYHFPPKMVEYDYPPKPWRNTAAGIADFMRLHGATHLATTSRRRAALIRASSLFTEVAFMPDGRPDSTYNITLFALSDAGGGRLFSGDARVEANFGQLRVTPGATSQAVLRYVWNPRLTADGTAFLDPAEVAPGISFIRVTFQDRNPVVIRYGKGRGAK